MLSCHNFYTKLWNANLSLYHFVIVVLLSTIVTDAACAQTNKSYKTINQQRFLELDGLDFVVGSWFKFDQRQLEERNNFIYWVAINDCGAATKYTNEFDWDGIKDFYKRKQSETFNDIDPIVHIKTFIEFGPYDRDKGGFPIKYQFQNYISISGVGLTRGQDTRLCSGYIPYIRVPPVYVEFDKAVPPFFAIDEQSARSYVDGRPSPSDRRANIHLVIRLLGLSKKGDNPSSASYSSSIKLSGRIIYAVITAGFLKPVMQDRSIGELVPPESTDLRFRFSKIRERLPSDLVSVP